MTLPVSALLGFAAWTLATLAFTIGAHRWSRILAGKARIDAFPADASDGPDWYRRATRAHLNCVENLPVFGAIVLAITATGATGRLFDVLPFVVLGARVCQTVTHVGFAATTRSVSVRFGFFFIQLAAMVALMVALARSSA